VRCQRLEEGYFSSSQPHPLRWGLHHGCGNGLVLTRETNMHTKRHNHRTVGACKPQVDIPGSSAPSHSAIQQHPFARFPWRKPSESLTQSCILNNPSSFSSPPNSRRFSDIPPRITNMQDPSDNTPSRELVLAHSQDDLPIVVIPPPTPAPIVSRPTPDPAPKAPRSGTVKKWLIAAVIALVIIVAVLGSVLGSRVSNSNSSPSESTGSSDNSGPSIDQGEPTSFPAPFDPPGESGAPPGTRTTQPGKINAP